MDDPLSGRMAPVIRQAQPDEVEGLIPLLLLAEPSERALRWGLAHLVDAVYCMERDGQPIGAATLRWRDDPAEIQELAIAPAWQRQGLGRRFVAWLLDEARRRGKRALQVGTDNASVENFLFYQRCGLRMDHVRRDYFWYYRPPRFKHGLQVRDMLVFRIELDGKE